MASTKRRWIRKYRTGRTRYPRARSYTARGDSTRAWLKLSIAVGVCALLVAAAGAPLILTSGAAVAEANRRIDSIEDLEEPPLAQTSTFTTSSGAPLATVFTQHRIEVERERIPQVLVDAIVAVEDARFYEHNGVDIRGLVRAAVTNIEDGGVTQGGSTITQQYAKNVAALSTSDPEAAAAATAKTLQRKLLEAHHAIRFEARYTKDEILTKYLNIAYFGSGAWGVEAAARTYFNTSVENVTLTEAATLAGLLQAPSATNPVEHPERARLRRNVVLSRMHTEGMITDDELAFTQASPLEVHGATPDNGCMRSPYPFFCDQALRELETRTELGDTPEERAETVRLGDMAVVTTIDERVQDAAQRIVDSFGRQHPMIAGIVVAEPGTGAVRAAAFNRDYGLAAPATTYPHMFEASHPGASLFKVFAVVAAGEAGADRNSTLPGGSTHASEVFDNPTRGWYTNADGGGAVSVTLAEATARSQNTAFIQLTEQLGVDVIADVADRMGYTFDGWPGEREGSISLGARAASVMEMANVYATLASGGVFCEPTTISEIRIGGDIIEIEPRCERVISQEVAAWTTSLLVGAVETGTGRAAAIGRPVAGKTGTAGDFGAAWFAGYTPQYSTAVFLGDPRGPAYPLAGLPGAPRIYGGGLPAELFSTVMTEIHEPFDVAPFPAPPAQLNATTGRARMPNLTGMEPARAAALIERSSDVAGVTVTGQGRSVVGTEPQAGAPITKRTDVVIVTE